MLLARCGGESTACTLGDLQAVQPDINVTSEWMTELDGRWFILRVSGMPSASEFSWFSSDIVPTPLGLVTYNNIRTKTSGCSIHAIERESTANRQVFSGHDGSSMVLAAMDGQGQHALVYTCASLLLRAADTCLSPVAMLVSRRSDVIPADEWMTSLRASSPLPCYDVNQSVAVSNGDGSACPLNQMVALPGRDCRVANFPVQANFDLTEYVSKPWKEMAWLAANYTPSSEFYQDYVHTYTLRPNGAVLCQVAARTPSDECLHYQINMTRTQTPGKLLFYYGGDDIPYNVISTDYDHYALVFGCVAVVADSDRCLLGKGWLWSRDVTLARELRLQANAMLIDMCINPAAMYSTTHSNPCVKGTSDADGSKYRPVSTTLIAMFLLCLALIAV
ncbi:uncharacterized protein LOC143280861 [Babylonia areolata]|uniref:uncharacterized protein LOC143280861 n=1 Tax=Babylonia areolata TaxID=304850 RepID=UPI003FD2A45E